MGSDSAAAFAPPQRSQLEWREGPGGPFRLRCRLRAPRAPDALAPSAPRCTRCEFREPSAVRIESMQGVNIFKRHGRAILTDEQAQTIFRHKPTAFAQDRDKAGLLARLYGR
jgi:hypothetical protein